MIQSGKACRYCELYYTMVKEKSHCKGETTLDCGGQESCSEEWPHPLTSLFL